MRRLKQLEDENAKLRKLVADLALDREMLQDDPPKNLRPGRKRELVSLVCGEWQVSIRRACAVLEFDTSSYHYKSCRPDQTPLAARIKAICETKRSLRLSPCRRAAAARGLACQSEADSKDLQ